jgi:hypothetical protein
MTAQQNLFNKYPNNVFVETGTYLGDGVQMALDAGFKTIYSIEIRPEYMNQTIERFKDFDNVYLVCDDSHLILDELLSKINEPITFWLDSHLCGGACSIAKYDSPLIKELEAIGRHHIKTHTILIDDLRLWNIETYGFNTEILKQKILEINPDYNFVFEDGHVVNDILVAKI